MFFFLIAKNMDKNNSSFWGIAIQQSNVNQQYSLQTNAQNSCPIHKLANGSQIREFCLIL